jgi:hypothetical protein
MQIGIRIAYEQGDLTNAQTIELFQELVNSGLAWQMGGHYRRRAECLIKQGKIKAKEEANEETEYENLSSVNTRHRVLNH